jgi:hypothetical protein
MIRKQTWFLLAIFAVLLGLAFYLRENPVVGSAGATPTPTSPVILLTGWPTNDIVWIEYQGEPDGMLELSRGENGGWLLGPGEAQAAQAGVVEQISTQIANIRVVTFLDPGYHLAALGLTEPARTIRIGDAQGRTTELRIGRLTPTGSGYYVQVDGQAPAVISKYGADAIFDLLAKNELDPPAPEVPADAPEPGNSP